MANIDAPMGAQAVKHANGGRIIANEYKSGAEVFRGDFVKKVSDGDVIAVAANQDVFGVAMNYASGDEKELHVYEDPYIVFMCQASAVVAEVDINSSADMVAGSGSTVTLQSGHEVSATAGSGIGEQLIIVDKVDRPDNAWGANVDLLVIVYEHQMQNVAQTPGGI